MSSVLTTDEQDLHICPDALIEERQDGQRDLLTFIPGAWKIVEPWSRPYQTNWHIEAIVDHLNAILTGDIRNLVILMPPRSMKSLLVSVFFPAWAWLQRPHLRFLYSSYAQQLSTRDSLKTRRVIQSPWYQKRWGGLFRIVSDQNVKMKFENDKTGYRLATSSGGSNTGEGGDIIVADDPHNVIDGESDLVREGTVEWWNTSMSTRGNDPNKSSKIVVMQRIHERDVAGDCLEKFHDDPTWTFLTLAAEFRPEKKCVTVRWEDPRTERDQLLWPARFSREFLTGQKKILGEYFYSGQYQQEPSPSEGGIFKRYWWRYWHTQGHPLPPVPVKMPDGSVSMIEAVPLPWTFDVQAQAWDMTFKGKAEVLRGQPDYVVGLDGAKKGPNMYLRDLTRGQWSFTQTLEACRVFHRLHPDSRAKLVEDAANGAAIIDSLKSDIPGFLAVPTRGGTEARAQANAPLVAAGNVFLPHPSLASWVPGFIEEFATFPNGAHDDQVASWSHLMSQVYGQHEEGIPITTEYDPRFHHSSKPLDPVPGLPSFRFWHVGYWMVCILGQVTPHGRIMLLDCEMIENVSLDQFITWKIQPLQNARYRGVSEWRDVWNRKMPNAMSPESEHNLLNIVGEKLNGSIEVGEPNFLHRVEAIKDVLLKVNWLTVNVACAPIHEALSGGFAYPMDTVGVVTQDCSRRNHPSSAVGEALGHGLARIFTRKPTPAPSTNGKPPQHRALNYAVS